MERNVSEGLFSNISWIRHLQLVLESEPGPVLLFASSRNGFCSLKDEKQFLELDRSLSDEGGKQLHLLSWEQEVVVKVGSEKSHKWWESE